jgi:DNA-binding IclR family transcriptional regulator
MSKIVKRTLDFIEMFAEYGRPLSLSEISKILNIPVSSCYDVLQSLQERGYIYELSPRGGFYPTLKLHELSVRIVANDPVIPRAEMRLRELRDHYDESVLLARVDGEKAVYLLVFEPSYPLRFILRVGDRTRSPYATSVGKALLGSLDERQFKKVIDKLELVPLTDKTIRSKDVLCREIAESRERGWYINREESVPMATTVSSTFKWTNSTFIITIAGPTFRMETKLDEVVSALLATCRELESPGTKSGPVSKRRTLPSLRGPAQR